METTTAEKTPFLTQTEVAEMLNGFGEEPPGDLFGDQH